MAIHFNDALILADGYDLTGDSNNVSLAVSAAELDATTFGNTHVVRQAGLKDWTLNASGFYSPTLDADTFNNFGGARVFTVAADSTDGAVAYSGTGRTFSYEQGGTIGELQSYSLNASGSAVPSLARGQIMLPRANYTSSGNGAVRQLGALSSTQRLYAFAHVLSATGTTPVANVIVQSAATAGFTSPTNQITMNALPVGSTTGFRAGAVTNTYWRVSYTISGTTPSFRMVIALAVI